MSYSTDIEIKYGHKVSPIVIQYTQHTRSLGQAAGCIINESGATHDTVTICWHKASAFLLNNLDKVDGLFAEVLRRVTPSDAELSVLLRDNSFIAQEWFDEPETVAAMLWTFEVTITLIG